MRTILARAHAREAACLWMLHQHPEESNFNRDEMIEAFVEGYGTRLTKDVLDGDELALTATVLDAASRGEAFTKSDAARAARAMLVARDRFGAIEDEQALERATGQRQLDDATALMTEAAETFRRYEAHHLDKAQTLWDAANPKASDDSAAKAKVNALIAARLEAWLRGEDQYPVKVSHDHPDGMTMHVQAPHLPPQIIRSQSAGQITSVIADDIPEADEEWFKRATLRGPVPNEVIVRHVPPADEGGCKDALRSSRTEPERTDSVAEPAAFRLNTPDPRFDPAKPVTVNGFLYLPTKEK